MTDVVWIVSHAEVARHPKTRRAARDLGISLPTMIGHLHMLWYFAAEFTTDGDLSRFSEADIDEAVEWPKGHMLDFVQALVDAGFLDETPSPDIRNGDNSVTSHERRLRIHDWDVYMGALTEKREANAARQRAWRERQRTLQTQDIPGVNGSNAHVTITGSALDNALQDPIRSDPNQTKSRIQTRARAREGALPPVTPGPSARRTGRDADTEDRQHYGRRRPHHTDTAAPRDFEGFMRRNSLSESRIAFASWCQDHGCDAGEAAYATFRAEQEPAGE